MKDVLWKKKMTGYIRNMKTYNTTVENFQAYIERLKQYLELNGIDYLKKVSVLLSVIGGKMFGLLSSSSLTQMEKSKMNLFDDLVQFLQNHISPKPIIIAETFWLLKQDKQ